MTEGFGNSWEWRSQAACRNIDSELFFPTAEGGRMRALQVSAAKAVCAGCPVRVQCLAEARIPYGIAGGLTAEERRGLPRSRWRGGLDVQRLAEALRVEAVPRRRALAQALRLAGWPTGRIAAYAGVSERTALRWVEPAAVARGGYTGGPAVGRTERGGVA
jgi:hypothetical protein